MAKKLVGTDDLSGVLPVVVIAAIDRRVKLQADTKSDLGHTHTGGEITATVTYRGTPVVLTVDALATKALTTETGLASLVSSTTSRLANKADLVGGKLKIDQLPNLAIHEFLGDVSSQAAMLAKVGERGDYVVRTDRGTEWQIIAEPSSTLANWRERTYPASPVSSVAGRTGAITLSSSDITDSGATGRTLFGATSQANARGIIGAGTSNVVVGTSSSQAMRGDKIVPVDVLPGTLTPGLFYFVRETP